MYDCERAVQAWHGKQAETKGQKSDDADDGDGERSILLHGVTSPLDSVICTATGVVRPAAGTDNGRPDYMQRA